MLADTFDALRPNLTRCTKLEEAEEAIQKLEQEEAKVAPELNVTNKTEPTVDEIEKDDSDDDEDIGDDSEGEEDDDDENDDEGIDSETEEEVTPVSLRRNITAPTTEEDEEFERELNKILHESVESRKSEPRKAPLDIPIPMNLLKGTSTTNNKRVGGPDEEQADTNEINFRLLMKKGNKQHAKTLRVPVDAKLAKTNKVQLDADREEHAEVKRMVLQYGEREEEGDDNGFGTKQENSAGGRGRGQSKFTKGKRVFHISGGPMPHNQRQNYGGRGQNNNFKF